MDGRQPEDKNDLHDDEIIDLNEVVQQENDGDIIDLTNILDQPEKSPGDTDSSDDEIIPLVDAVSDESTADAPQAIEDEIIDLTDMAATPDSPATDEASEEISLESEDDDAEEEVIDLQDIAKTLESEISDSEVSVPGAPSIADSADTDEAVIDLREVATPQEPNGSEPDGTALPEQAEAALAEDENGDEEEVIDLMEVAETEMAPITPPEDETATVATGDSSTDEDEDEIIDLMDVSETEVPAAALPDEDAEPEEPAVASTDENEDEIIDLMDVSETEVPAAALPDGDAEAEEPADAFTDEDEDEIIDLMEPAVPEVDSTEMEAETSVESDDDFSDLESRAEAMLRDTTYRFDYDPEIEAAETAGPDADFGLFEADAITEDEGSSNPPVDLDQTDDGPAFIPVAPTETPSSGEGIMLTEQQLEAALIAAIEKIYGERIEQLLLETVEKTVRREIAKIKNALLDDDDDLIA